MRAVVLAGCVAVNSERQRRSRLRCPPTPGWAALGRTCRIESVALAGEAGQDRQPSAIQIRDPSACARPTPNAHGGAQRMGNPRIRTLPSPSTTMLPSLRAPSMASRLPTISSASCSTPALDPSDVEDRGSDRPRQCQDCPEVRVGGYKHPVVGPRPLQHCSVGRYFKSQIGSVTESWPCSPRTTAKRGERFWSTRNLTRGG